MDKITPPQNTKENENRENTQNNNYFKEHLTHYKKIKLTKDISLRYFYSYQDKKNLIGKWVIKSHKQKKYSIIDLKTVDLILLAHNKNIEDYIEIRGKVHKKGFQKIMIKPNGKVKIKYEIDTVK